MATAKKGGKSTKTAHVLNLLTAPGASVEREADAPEDAAPAASVSEPEEQPAISSRPLTPPILEVARSNDEQISEQIRDALENALLEELGEEEPPQSAPAQPESEPEPIPAPPVEPEPELEPILEPAPAEALEPALEPAEVPEPPNPEPPKAPEPPKPPEPSKPEPVKAPEPPKPPEPSKPEPPKAPEPPKPDLVVLNIMEKLVELKAPRYISMFGLCSCERCAADVRALTLTNLQPHYLVVPRNEAHAAITIFESRFNSTIFAQLTRACKVVMDNPRH